MLVLAVFRRFARAVTQSLRKFGRQIGRQSHMTLANQFDQLDVNAIRQFRTDGREEDIHLEFKTVNDPEMNRDDRKNLAKCISGFANSDGGMVVWGVEAKKNADGIDCVSSLPEIDRPQLFLTKLNEFTGQSVSPLVDGVRHKILETSTGRGYAATLIPQSNAVPHMAMPERRYYKRSGDSFYVMEHFDLDDMFGRRQKPDLALSIVPQHELRDEREQVGFVFFNTGRALAKHTGFVAKCENATIANVSGGTMQDSTRINAGRPTVTFFRQSVPFDFHFLAQISHF